MKEINDVLNYKFEAGDVVVWNECGLVAICESEEEAKELGITKDDAESYFIYDIDEDVTENFNKERFGNILSAQQASIILGVSTARIYTLLKECRIGSRESGISYDKVIDYKNNRKAGRPIGSYKKQNNNCRNMK